MSSKHINDDHFETKKVCTDIIVSIRTSRYPGTYTRFTSWREFIATQEYISNYQKSAVYHFDAHMHARTRKYTLLLNSFYFPLRAQFPEIT